MTRGKKHRPVFNIRWLRYTALVSILLCLCFGCGKKADSKSADRKPGSQLNIYALDWIRESGFEAAVLKEFGLKNDTAVNLRTFPDLTSLLQALEENPQGSGADLVLGLDNTMALGDSLTRYFTPAEGIDRSAISYEIPQPDKSPLLPYAFGNLVFVYNQKMFPEPPRSFGELQDSRFYNQLAVCDPKSSGLGRGILLWSVALFGDSGYDQLWQSLRKNVRKVYPRPSEAYDALRKGECGLMLGFHSTAAWIAELNPPENQFRFVNPQEGSFLYVESAALCADAPNPKTALKFLQYLIGNKAQQQVIYKLGLMPVNGRTPLPLSYASLPLSIYSLNDRLPKYDPAANLSAWIRRWDELFLLRAGI